MPESEHIKKITEFAAQLEGELFTDLSTRLIYSSDASVFREKPLAVACPKNVEDIKKLIYYAQKEKISLIPRAAGTSLAGQVVGSGIVVDISRYMTRLLEFNKEQKWIWVQPGVILDELNKYLEPYKLVFGPDPSTSNRCMLGGMVGNNACGSHSLIYGCTRDHVLALKTILSDGSETEFHALNKQEFEAKCNGNNFESSLYRNIRELLSSQSNQSEIRSQFPDKSIKRRNTGYAVDLLLESEPFTETSDKFNFCKMLTGSEGTLAFITEIKLGLSDLPPKETALVCVHCEKLEQAFHANLIALKYAPAAVELIDNYILECTKSNIEQNKNRFFIKGEPEAILAVEFFSDSRDEILKTAVQMEAEMRKAGFGYHFPVLFGNDIKKVWSLRKAGLGLLSNIPGDNKPVGVIEDTAVKVEDLPDYMAKFRELLAHYRLKSVYYAHIGSGELHLKPLLNLKTDKDVEFFHTFALDVAKLVKSFNGSLSGEHGDGRLRGEFIPLLLGERNYLLLKQIKEAWDPHNIFNPGKIVDTPKMNTSLRYDPKYITKEITTWFDFSDTYGIIRAIEKCNGSADCRKPASMGGIMCPSYMATKNENNTTRARVNLLREIIGFSNQNNPFNHHEIYKILDLCLMCKGCKSECPSSVDMTRIKSEALQQYYLSNHVPLRTKIIANITAINRYLSHFPAISNFFILNKFTSSVFKSLIGFAIQRSLPALCPTTLSKWAAGNLAQINSNVKGNKAIYLFIDEFTEYYDVEIGIKAIKLLSCLGYKILIPDILESGRAYISKGLLKKARRLADYNVSQLKNTITENIPLIGIEPSCLYTFKDEYPALVSKNLVSAAKNIAKNCMMLDEFIAIEIENKRISRDYFKQDRKEILLHGHCHQKSLASTGPLKKMLFLPVNYKVSEIPSGCCGMAGAFGYEKEHFELSNKIGELILFPEIRKAGKDVIITAPGTSCRQHILENTGRKAYHPVEILYEALL
ncbi:MAG: FAD-binding protein [Bacteroidia bacterium]|nr:FAD-binding protein [Bacteroidia bacterium]